MEAETQEQRLLRKAREGLAAGLKAGIAAQATSNLLRLPEDERGAMVGAVGALFRSEVAKAFAAGRWSGVHEWAPRVEAEPRLLSAGAPADPTGGVEARWMLLWACIRARDWGRARVHLDGLRPVLPARLLAALEVLVLTSGAPGPEALALFGLPALPAPDPRLGYDRPRQPKAPPLPAPQSAGEVEARTLACFARGDWEGFRTTVERWLLEVQAPLRGPLSSLSSRLAVRELLRGAGSTRSLAGPARWIVRCCTANGALPELEETVALALRLFVSALPAAVESRSDSETLLEVGGAAARFPALREQVVGTLLAKKFTVEASAAALRLTELFLEAGPEPRLLLRALRLLFLRPPAPEEGLPAGLRKPFAAALAQGSALRAAVLELSGGSRAQSLMIACELAPLDQAEQLLELLWPGADAGLLSLLENTFADLLDRAQRSGNLGSRGKAGAQSQEMLRRMARSMGTNFSKAELDRLLDSPMGDALRQDLEGDATSTPVSRALWSRFAERLLPRGVRFLALALEESKGAEQNQRALARFLAGRTGAVEILQAMRDATVQGYTFAEELLEDELHRRYQRDPDQLAAVLLAADRMGAPPDLMRDLARTLLKAAADSSASLVAPEVARALAMARKLAPRPKPTRKQGPKAGPQRNAGQRPPPLKPAPPPLAPRVKGAPFEPRECVARCKAWLQGAYAASTATAYAGVLARLLRDLDQRGEREGIRSAEALLAAGEGYWRALEASGRAAGPARSAVLALGRFIRTEEAP